MWDAIGRLQRSRRTAARAGLGWATSTLVTSALTTSLLVSLLVSLLGACGGPTYEAGVYRDEEARYRIGDLGPTWERLDVAQNDLAWLQPSSGAIVQVNATCDPYRDVPLTSLTNHLLIGFTERDWRSSEVVDMDDREARRSHVVASLDGVPRELLLYVMKKDSCVYDFALVAPPGPGFARAEPDFERFVASFHAPSAEPR